MRDSADSLLRRHDALLRRADVELLTGLSRSSIYRLISEGSFPRPVKVGERAVRWPASAIEAWRAARPATVAEDHPPAAA